VLVNRITNNQPIEHMGCEKLLGVNADNNLKWKLEVEHSLKNATLFTFNN